jgi:alpha-mannosidase
VAEEGRGFAVLNDCKYGVDVVDGTIALTLLKSALAPDMTADRGMQEFTYAILPWTGSLADSPVVREAYDLNVPVVTAAGEAGEASLFSVDAANVVIEAVKPAEDGSGDAIVRDAIVRLYEAKRTATRCVLRTALPVRGAARTDLLEREVGKLECRDGAMTLELRAFEIATVRLKMG